ncbi:hypothetical protein ABPG75_013917 [Micractinium tetrahymenae]
MKALLCDPERMKPGGGLAGHRRSCLLAAVSAAVAAVAFLNTLPAQFTFDDSFAVLYNGDVTDHNKPLRALLHNDFWGQDLRSPMSHKSYRPLTVLSFRLQHWVSTRLLPAARAHPQRSEWEEEGRRSGDSTLNPLPFHACNMAAHAGVTALMFVLARRLVMSRSLDSNPSAAAGGGGSSAGSSAAAAGAGHRGGSWAADAEAFIAALLFGLHPVHCEAVAGIVGHAELLCAALSIPALLCYMAAAGGRAGRGAAHWRAVGAAVLLGWAAALTKEIGITIMGAMLCYDALVVPLAAPLVPVSAPGQLVRICRKLVRICRKLVRICRKLVRIYRRVENPVAFSESSLERKLTTGYLHARYAWLLLAPLQLSADWSYACIDYVSSLSDPRNLATAALYLFLLWLGLSARPWQVLLEWAGRRPLGPSSQAQHERRWRLAVAAGLLVGPFFPASNVLFYVGTFIGERLLYFPSVGYCILLAQPLAAALRPLLSQESAGDACKTNGSGSSSGSSNNGSKAARLRRAGAVLAAAMLAGLLLFFAGRTVLRNEDWRDEERLFLSAQKVCWRSGKVQLNSGIVERRHQNWDKAEMHFRLAKQVDPGFCEPDYHIGITLLSKNLTAAIEQLELGVRCKYTAADSVKALNRIYMSLLERSPDHAASVLERWAAVLAFPELQRYTEAATYFETAAAKAGSPLAAIMILNRAQAALAEARPVAVGRTPSHPVRVPASQRQLEVLRRCMAGRRPVVLAVLGAGGRLRAPEVKQAAYRYIAKYGGDCRGPVPVPDSPEADDSAARTTSYHTNLLHSLQEADPNDPWLQQEWGLMLVAAGRHQEALVHLEVAGHIFAAQLVPTAGDSAADGAPRAGTQHGAVLNAEGTGPISKPAAAAAAVAAYRHAQAAVDGTSAGSTGRIDPAARQRVLCHLRQAECGVLQAAAALPGTAAGAAADALGCWGRAQALGCVPSSGSSGGGKGIGGEAGPDEQDRQEL